METGISIHKDVFDEKFCRFLFKNGINELSKGNSFRRSNFHWDTTIVRASQVVLVRDYDEALSKVILSELVRNSIIDNYQYHVMNYVWTKLSYIPWHNDDHRKTAMTVYLNEEWDEDWGGVFLYKDASTGQIKGYAPKFNTAIKNDGHIQHATTMITPDAACPRITLQLFSQI
jgi:Rps23 Pro-64 3,4-dihydroxylase Tpa1-like proline 4-hydroxylase